MKDKNDSFLISRPEYQKKIEKFIGTPLIKVVTGLRRVGKSSLLRLVADGLVSQGVDSNRILFINMESLENEPFRSIKNLHTAVKEAKLKTGSKIFLFIDEVQEINGWEKCVNSFLADDDADIYISGSNSNLLSGELATLLTGRFVEFQVLPLTFTEYLSFRNKSSTNHKTLFFEFLRFGGMPGIHHLDFTQEAVHQYLAALIDSVVLKDVVIRNDVRDVSLLEKLIRFIADNSGNIFSARSVADYFKKERRRLGIETVYNYLTYLETAYIINRVSRYDLKGKRQLETLEKYYVTDIGLRHALIGYKEQDINVFLENVVYLELRKRGYTVEIGKLGELEIDFIASKENLKRYLQVAYLLTDEQTRDREFKPLRLVQDNFPKYVVSMDEGPAGNDNGIIRMYILDFLS
jgi:hypothetical protein